MKRWWIAPLLLLAFLGLADDFYLAQHEADGTPLICTVQNLTDCNAVVNSQYSHLFGIPLSELGIVFFGFIFIVSALEWVLLNRMLRRLLQVSALVGAFASLIFVLLQVFVIKALCIYCLASAAISFLVFIVAGFIEPIRLRPKGESGTVVEADPQKEKLTMPPA